MDKESQTVDEDIARVRNEIVAKHTQITLPMFKTSTTVIRMSLLIFGGISFLGLLHELFGSQGSVVSLLIGLAGILVANFILLSSILMVLSGYVDSDLDMSYMDDDLKESLEDYKQLLITRRKEKKDDKGRVRQKTGCPGGCESGTDTGECGKEKEG